MSSLNGSVSFSSTAQDRVRLFAIHSNPVPLPNDQDAARLRQQTPGDFVCSLKIEVITSGTARVQCVNADGIPIPGGLLPFVQVRDFGSWRRAGAITPASIARQAPLGTSQGLDAADQSPHYLIEYDHVYYFSIPNNNYFFFHNGARLKMRHRKLQLKPQAQAYVTIIQ
ncbi:hypothetical protein EIP91_002192 [Steccherinum ochraceum]|uniref:Uncharacterized protein n=1 Tax=Steccherinum ochraceum TaxID=92696 RepID=A0A4R0RL30_9APHY|nr:hypothetical protein EIP91_002192 [Steccherinum ochraceum]